MAIPILDIHTHTIASGHATTSTITDMAKTAKDNGLELLGISDHGPATLHGGAASYFRNLAYAPKKRFAIDILYGVEANILDDKGTLDLDNSILDRLDFVIASMHSPHYKSGNIAENTATYIEVIKRPNIHIIGHCDDVNYPVDYHALIKAAIEYQVLLEINESSLRPDGYRGDTRSNALMILNLCKHYKYPLLLSSDSHGTSHIGDFTYALELLKLADIPDTLVLNYSPKALLAFLNKK